MSGGNFCIQGVGCAFLVFFETGKFDLKPGAIDVVSNAARKWKQSNGAHLSVDGHTDANESNKTLASQRAEAVKNRLVKDGVPAGFISVKALGEEKLLLPTLSGVAHSFNRRVEIWIGQPS